MSDVVEINPNFDVDRATNVAQTLDDRIRASCYEALEELDYMYVVGVLDTLKLELQLNLFSDE